jgi:hypothetical protein
MPPDLPDEALRLGQQGGSADSDRVIRGPNGRWISVIGAAVLLDGSALSDEEFAGRYDDRFGVVNVRWPVLARARLELRAACQPPKGSGRP